MKETKTERRNLEERTEAFFNQDVNQLAEQLQGRVIIEPETGKQIRLIGVRAYERDQVGPRYKEMNMMQAGDLYVIRLPVRRMNQSLVVAKDQGQVGACVRLMRVEYFDSVAGAYMPVLEIGSFGQREGDIARYLGLQDGEVAKLKFLDESEILYLEKGQSNVSSLF